MEKTQLFSVRVYFIILLSIYVYSIHVLVKKPNLIGPPMHAYTYKDIVKTWIHPILRTYILSPQH